MKGCLDDEEDARKTLAATWSRVFQRFRGHNAQGVERQTAGMASYVELLTCLQLKATSRRARSGRANEAIGPSAAFVPIFARWLVARYRRLIPSRGYLGRRKPLNFKRLDTVPPEHHLMPVTAPRFLDHTGRCTDKAAVLDWALDIPRKRKRGVVKPRPITLHCPAAIIAMPRERGHNKGLRVMTTPAKSKSLPPPGETRAYPVLPLRDIVVFPT